MDTKEMKALEKKTRAIVDALSNLESETKRQKDMGDKLDASRDAILELATRLALTADNLADTIELLRKSSLADDINRFDRMINETVALTEQVRGDVREAERLCQDAAKVATDAGTPIRDVGDRIGDIEAACKELLSNTAEIIEIANKRDNELTKRIEAIESSLSSVPEIQSSLRELRDQARETESASSKRYDKLAERIGSLEGVVGGIGTTAIARNELLKDAAEIGAMAAARDEEIVRLIMNLESVMGRIDRNTQKGIGKERG